MHFGIGWFIVRESDMIPFLKKFLATNINNMFLTMTNNLINQ